MFLSQEDLEICLQQANESVQFFQMWYDMLESPPDDILKTLDNYLSNSIDFSRLKMADLKKSLQDNSLSQEIYDHLVQIEEDQMVINQKKKYDLWDGPEKSKKIIEELRESSRVNLENCKIHVQHLLQEMEKLTDE